jgi:hypothetical protein
MKPADILEIKRGNIRKTKLMSLQRAVRTVVSKTTFLSEGPTLTVVFGVCNVIGIEAKA